jgi:predicted membrane chloride channel (bestrophin family)
MDLIDGSLLLHGWIMGSYLRGKALKGVQEAQLLRFASGRTEERAADVKVAMTPYLAITALSLGVSRRLPSLTDQEEVAIDEELGKLTDALGKCEKLLRAPIPLGYTRYSVRFLWLWLSLLPFALASTFAEFDAGTFWADKPQPVLAVAMLFVSFIFLSIEDIAVQIEEPFAILPLIKCHKWLLADVRRMRALVTSPTEPAAATDDGGAGDGA